MKKILLFLLLSVTTFFANAQTTKTLNALSSFGFNGDGSIRPGNVTWVDNLDMNQRGIAHDPVTGYLVYINSQSGTAGTNTGKATIEILDPTGGFEIRTLNTNGITGGTYAEFAVG